MPEPSATYRLQLHAGFGFDDAAAIFGYLKALGISHVYCSPYLQAAPGSTHGYDVADYSRVNQELGGPEAHARFLDKLRETGLGQVLDIVPNHMSIAGRSNRWWWDVLENGPASIYASYFDIDWQGPEEKLRNKVLAPVLGNHYGRVLAAGEIRLQREPAGFVFRYFDHVYPAAPKSLAPLLSSAAERIRSDYLAFLADALAALPDEQGAARHRDKEVIRSLLARLCEEDQNTAKSLDTAVDVLNRDPDALDALLERQHYRLSYWRTAARDLGYRRFFDINTLVGLHMEDQRVFDDTHRLILQWVREGAVDGLRVDHPDGLRDPELYFERLHNSAPNAWIVAEKILEPGEAPRRSWMISGTTGYDFLNTVGGLFVDPRGEQPLTRFYGEFTGEHESWQDVAINARSQVLRDMLGSDLNRLTAMFVEVCERHRDNRDYTRHEIHQAIRELVACFPVYRTYIRAEQGQSGEEDERIVGQAIDLAKSRRPDVDPDLFGFLESILLLRERGDSESDFVMQFQQFTGPAMAKGVEDTAFYQYNRLVSLNEVGGDPGRFGVSIEDFHAWCERMRRDWPRTMLATSTHDTKRGEDVRARISLLSEIPDRWMETAGLWSRLNEPLKKDGVPDRNTEYLLYQTLVGAWPIDSARLRLYMQKAVREAKRATSWTNPNEAWEKALDSFLDAMLANESFVRNLGEFVESLKPAAHVASLSQTLVKLTAPGIPDTYQGTDLWDLNLVDPDNRRPVDYARRAALLAELDGLTPEQILARSEEGLPKLWVIRQALRARSSLGPYQRLIPTGEKASNAIAFSRGAVIVIAPRLAMASQCGWTDTTVEFPAGKWRNEFTQAELEGSAQLATLFERFPVALLRPL